MKKKRPANGSYYEVFARETADAPLVHIGTHPAANAELAMAQTVQVYSEKPYVEMCVVRRDDIHLVRGPNSFLGNV